MTCSRMKIAPISASGPKSGLLSCTAATRTPIAIANAAGSVPRSTSTIHHAVASPRSALGREAKKIHSLRSARRISSSLARDLLVRHRRLPRKRRHEDGGLLQLVLAHALGEVGIGMAGAFVVGAEILDDVEP